MSLESGKKSAAEMRAAQRERLSQAETATPAVVVTEKNLAECRLYQPWAGCRRNPTPRPILILRRYYAYENDSLAGKKIVRLSIFIGIG